jgi:hydrogenase 3 maturation protease
VVIIVDAADMNAPAGTTRVIDPAQAGGASFATHGLPLGVLAGYLRAELGCKVILIGIQPLSVDYGQSLSGVVDAAAQELADALLRCLS